MSMMQVSCECGREVAARPTQAGVGLPCVCGRTVQVPAWRKPAEEDAPPAPRRSRLTALGWTFLLVELAVVVIVGLATWDTLQLEPGAPRKAIRLMIAASALLPVLAV